MYCIVYYKPLISTQVQYYTVLGNHICKSKHHVELANEIREFPSLCVHKKPNIKYKRQYKRLGTFVE